MAIYRTGQASMDAQGYITGYDTKWREQLTLIRPGATIFFLDGQLQAAVITEVIDDTHIRAISTGGAVVNRTNYIILLHDSITVDGLAQDVAETLRYYQGKETVIEEAIEFFKTFKDWDRVNEIVQQIKQYSDSAKTSADNAAQANTSANQWAQNASNSASESKTARDQSVAANTAAQQAKTEAQNANTSAQGAKDNAAQAAADALNYRNQAQSIVGSNIGLGASPRDCPDISGNPSGYIGFMRIRENVPGWPSIASGEAFLTGFISVRDGTPTYSGVFVGWATRSLYTYGWSPQSGPQWARHARKDEVSRLVQIANDQTRLYAGNGTTYIEVGNDRAWGVYDTSAGQWKPLGVEQGGTGGRNVGQARTNLQVFHESWDNLGRKDLDTLTGEYSGLYFNGLSADCTPERNYPEKTAGALKVIRNRANGNSGCSQYYYPFNTNDRYYSRWFNAADMVWTAWNEWRRPSDNDDFRNLIGLGRNNVRDFLTLALRSTYSQPLSIASANPTIRFDETDRPSGSPLYEFVFDGGNWRIQKGGAGYSGEYVISYEYINDRIVINNLKVDNIFVPGNKLQNVKNNLLIPNTGLSRWIDYNAPAGAESGKYYPVAITHPAGWNGDAFIEVSMRTRSLSGAQEPNCNLIHLWIRDAGWSDMGQGAFGHYHCYDAGEVAILCVRGTDKGQYPHNVIYVRGDAFPIRLSTTVGCTVTIPTEDWRPSTASDSPIYKWGIADANDGTTSEFGCTNLLNFTRGRTGFYSNNQFVDGNGNKYLRDGLGDGGTITLGIANLVNNGKITSNGGIIAQGDVTEEFSFISKLTDSGVTTTKGQSEFRAGENQGQVVVRDLTSAQAHKFFNFNLDGTFNSPNGYVTYTGSSWENQHTDSVNKFKPISGSDGPSSGLTCAGVHIGYGGTSYGQIAIGYDNIYFRNNGSGGTNKWFKLAKLQSHNTFESTTYFGDLVRFYDKSLTRNFEFKVSGTSEQSAQCEVWGSTGSRPTVIEHKITGIDGTGSKWCYYGQMNTDKSMVLAVNGAINCVVVNQSSDRDLKDNIEAISGATEAIRKMKGYTYTLKENGLPYAGVIAQEVMEAIPEAVGSFTHYGEALQGPTIDGNELREETRYLNVDYSGVVGLLVQVCRESDDRISKLEKEVEELKAAISALINKPTTLES